MATAFFRPRAIDDLVEIGRYIAQNNTERAQSFISEIEQACHVRAGAPLSGRPRFNLADALRSFVHGHYVVFYLPESEGITVVRVLHAKRDLSLIFD